MTVEPWSRTEDTSTRLLWVGDAAVFLWAVRTPSGKRWGARFAIGYAGNGAPRPTLAEGRLRRTRELAEADAEELADGWLCRALLTLAGMRRADQALRRP